MGRALDELVSKIIDDDLSQSFTETNLQAMSAAEMQHFTGYVANAFQIANCIYFNQATGYASQHIWCLYQARINWEGCVRRASCIKMVGWQRWGHQLVWMGWQSIRTVGVSASVIFILLQKSRRW